MTLNHLNLAVSDVAQTQAFLETYFGLRPIMQGSKALTVMRDDAGMVLTLSNFDKANAVNYPDHFHIGFVQSSEEQVNDLYQRLRAADVEAEPPRRFHGSWTFYLRAPGGFLIEVLH